MRKILLGVVAAAAIATPLVAATAANATVAVENGVGHVDSIDVRNKFGGNNSAFQGYAPSVTFSATHSETLDNEIQCGKYGGFVGGQIIWTKTGTFHRVNTTPVTQTVGATLLRNSGNGNVVGWDLTGLGAPLYGTHTSAVKGACEAGSYDIGTASQTITITPTVLQATKGTQTFDLPNTPVVAPVV